jgi:cysteine desulfurase family protein
MIYFDQAASSFPKPAAVVEAVTAFMVDNSANPGRSGHRMAREANGVVNQTRELAVSLFGCSNPKKALFYQNATVALNQALQGLQWESGDHIVASSMEHNSIRRPLEYLKKHYGVHVSYVDWSDEDAIFLEKVKNEINVNTKLIAMTHASNVTGAILPMEAVMDLAKQKGIITLVDASQTAGHIPIHMREQQIDMLVFPGHKGLLGPQGTGMLLVEGELDLNPLHYGGTGAFSELPDQPDQWPEKLESGTLNTPGIAGLHAALLVYKEQKDEIVPRETNLTKKLLKGLKTLGITCYGPDETIARMPVVAFNVKGIDSQEIAMVLDSHYEIAVRAGLHCSPLTHETLQTSDQGVVRASLGRYNTDEEVVTFLSAIEEIVTAYEQI